MIQTELQKEVQWLRKQLELLQQENKFLRQENEILKAENKKLKEQLLKNSRNSSKPPSSDGFKKEPAPNPKSQREKSGRSSGGQKGHKGHKLKKVEQPDEIILHQLNVCPKCHSNLSNVKILRIDARQLFDIPPLSIRVTEHQAEVKRCNCCGMQVYAEFPEGLIQEAQYGPRIKSLLTYLNQFNFITHDRTEKFVRDVFRHKISEGTVDNILNYCNDILEPVEALIKESLLKAPVLHHDETGMRVTGKLNWQHVASTDQLTCYAIHSSRGHKAIEAVNILPRYQGCLVHDHFRPYFVYGARHVLCNAHHLRELTFIEEACKQQWARQMKDLLKAIKKQVDWFKKVGEKKFPEYRIRAYERCYDEILMKGLWHPDNIHDEVKTEKAKSRKKNKARNLLERLWFYKKETLAFMYDFTRPFDNNLAERDLRMSKVKQKVSGCFRSKKGADRFCRIRSYISTARKQGIQILSALEQAFLGKPFMPTMKLNL